MSGNCETRVQSRVVAEKEKKGGGGEEVITREGKPFLLVCDICGDDAGQLFDEFYEAVEYKKSNGWKSQKNAKGEWEDVCSECQD